MTQSELPPPGTLDVKIVRGLHYDDCKDQVPRSEMGRYINAWRSKLKVNLVKVSQDRIEIYYLKIHLINKEERKKTYKRSHLCLMKIVVFHRIFLVVEESPQIHKGIPYLRCKRRFLTTRKKFFALKTVVSEQTQVYSFTLKLVPGR